MNDTFQGAYLQIDKVLAMAPPPSYGDMEAEGVPETNRKGQESGKSLLSEFGE